MKKSFNFPDAPPARGLLTVMLLAIICAVTVNADEVAAPHLTEHTKFLHRKASFNNLEFYPVSEGIFAYKDPDNNLVGFWTIDGKCLFDTRFKMMRERPLFDHGAAVVKDKENAKIVYANGASRQLPESYKEVSQFHDGVATVSTGGMGVKKPECFCINTNGDRIWPTLGPGDILEVGYLRDGLRRVKVRTEPSEFRYVTRWGFIDDDGKWIIKPTFREVREFNNGYALVISEDEQLQFINVKGEVVYQFEEKFGRLHYARGISDISDGYFMREMNSTDSRFYDLKGNCVAKYARASGFTDGYAFVQEDPDSVICVVNTKFKKVRSVLGLNRFSARQQIGAGNPVFGAARLGTIDKCLALTPDGKTIIKTEGRDDRIGDFLPDAYAPAEANTNAPGSNQKYDYVGYINRLGEFEVVFVGNRNKMPGELPADSIPTDTIGEISVKYKVKVVASPSDAGKVSGGGEYSYGDIVKVGARAEKGWRFTGITSDNRFSSTSKINEFNVRGDMVITVHFVKEDVVTDTPTGVFSGVKSALEVNDTKATGLTLPIYLETSTSGDIKTPYGDATRGFMALMLDPDQTLIFESYSKNNEKKRGTFTLNAFFVPMKVIGEIEENGRKYLALDGGVMKTNNMRMISSGAQAADVSALESLMVNLMLMFDGADASISGGSYRIEMNDIDPKTGAFTFGMMQRFHPEYGWISAGSDAFKKIGRGFFITKVDKGFPADYFNGIRMTPAQKRDDILWSPTPGFFEGNKSNAEEFATDLGKRYRDFQSEYEILQDVDLSTINSLLDTVLKPK